MPNRKEKDDGILSDFDELEELPELETSRENQIETEVDKNDNFEEELVQKDKEEKSLDLSVDDFPDDSILQATSNVSVSISAVIGKTSATVRELLEYKNGTIVDLHRSPGETVDMVAGGRLIARGELVDVDGRLGVKILKVLR